MHLGPSFPPDRLPRLKGDGADGCEQRLARATLPVETVRGDDDETCDALPFTDQERSDDWRQIRSDATFLAIASVKLFTKGF